MINQFLHVTVTIFTRYTAGSDVISTGSGAENQKYWTKLVNSKKTCFSNPEDYFLLYAVNVLCPALKIKKVYVVEICVFMAPSRGATSGLLLSVVFTLF